MGWRRAGHGLATEEQQQRGPVGEWGSRESGLKSRRNVFLAQSCYWVRHAVYRYLLTLWVSVPSEVASCLPGPWSTFMRFRELCNWSWQTDIGEKSWGNPTSRFQQPKPRSEEPKTLLFWVLPPKAFLLMGLGTKVREREESDICQFLSHMRRFVSVFYLPWQFILTVHQLFREETEIKSFIPNDTASSRAGIIVLLLLFIYGLYLVAENNIMHFTEDRMYIEGY